MRINLDKIQWVSIIFYSLRWIHFKNLFCLRLISQMSTTDGCFWFSEEKKSLVLHSKSSVYHTCTAIFAIHQEINNTYKPTANQIPSHALHQDMKPMNAMPGSVTWPLRSQFASIKSWFQNAILKLTLVPAYLLYDGLTGAGRAGCGGTFTCLRSNEETLLLDQLQRPGPLLPWGREYEDWGLKCLLWGPTSIGPLGPLWGPFSWT